MLCSDASRNGLPMREKIFDAKLGKEAGKTISLVSLAAKLASHCCRAYAIDHTPTYAGGACKISSPRTSHHLDHHIIYSS